MKYLSTLVFAVALTLHGTEGTSRTIQVPNGGPWGLWGSAQLCPPGTKAVSVSLKVEPHQKAGDDTSLNGIRLECRDPTFAVRSSVTSAVGAWGVWGKELQCNSLLVGFQLQVQPPSGIHDDTAATNIRFRCANGAVIEGYGQDWGVWGPWSEVCPRGICGIVTKVESKTGVKDDTALNDVKFVCCEKHA